jgi:hypothetical protein
MTVLNHRPFDAMLNKLVDTFNTKATPMAKRVRRKATAVAAPRRLGLEERQAPYGDVLEAAERSGLLKEKTTRISGRVSPALIAEATRRTGIASDTELIEFALANLALEDNFPQAFEAAHGKVDPDIKLGY